MEKVDYLFDRVKNIKHIFKCEDCGKVVYVELKGGKYQVTTGFFQCGGNKKNCYSWCSDKCFNKYYGKQKNKIQVW